MGSSLICTEFARVSSGSLLYLGAPQLRSLLAEGRRKPPVDGFSEAGKQGSLLGFVQNPIKYNKNP